MWQGALRAFRHRWPCVSATFPRGDTTLNEARGPQILAPSSLQREGCRAVVPAGLRSAFRNLSIELCLKSLGPMGLERLSLTSACRILSGAMALTRPVDARPERTTGPKRATGDPVPTYVVELPVPFGDCSAPRRSASVFPSYARLD